MKLHVFLAYGFSAFALGFSLASVWWSFIVARVRREERAARTD